MPETPYKYVLGENPDVIEFNNSKELQELAECMATQAHRTLDIFTPDLESRIYNTREFAQAIAELAGRSRFSEIRILVKDPERSVKSGHRLVEISRKFTTHVKAKRLNPEYHGHIEAFMIVDGRGIIYRKHAEHYIGHACFNDPLQARDLTRFFIEAWEISEPDDELRRLHI